MQPMIATMIPPEATARRASRSLRDDLAESAPDLAQALAHSWRVAQEQWLPALGVNLDSFNSYPHLRNVEAQLTAVVRGWEALNPDQGPLLSPVETYLTLMACLMHDIGRIRHSKDGHGTASRELILESFAVLGIPSRELAESLAGICEYHDPDPAQIKSRQAMRWKLRTVTVPEYGEVRELSLASLLTLADVMDGALTRVLPWYVRPKTDLQVVGAFRSLIRGITLDHALCMIRTSLGENVDERAEPDPTAFRARYDFQCHQAKKGVCPAYQARGTDDHDCRHARYTETELLDWITHGWRQRDEETSPCPRIAEAAQVAHAMLGTVWQQYLTLRATRLCSMVCRWLQDHTPSDNTRKAVEDMRHSASLLMKLQAAGEGLYAMHWSENETPPDTPCLLLHSVKAAVADSRLWETIEGVEALACMAVHQQHGCGAGEKVKMLDLCREICRFESYHSEDTSTAGGQRGLRAIDAPWAHYPLLRRYLADRRRRIFMQAAIAQEPHSLLHLPQSLHAGHWLVVNGNFRMSQPKGHTLPWPTAGLLATVLGNVTISVQDLDAIRRDLAELGIPIYAWLIEYRERLYTRQGQETYEPILTGAYLERVAEAMWNLSSRVFGVTEFSYAMLADYMYENDLFRVKVAVRRIAIVTRHLRRECKGYSNRFLTPDTADDAGPAIRCGARTWRWEVVNQRNDCQKFACRNSQNKHCELASLAQVKQSLRKLVDPSTSQE